MQGRAEEKHGRVGRRYVHRDAGVIEGTGFDVADL